MCCAALALLWIGTAAPHASPRAARLAPVTAAASPRPATEVATHRALPGPATTLPPPTGTDYVAPLTDTLDLVRGFDPPAQRWDAGHRGVDLRAVVGQQVVSPGPGSVTFAGRVAGRGVVTIAHLDGLRSSVEPVTASVTVGTAVTAGQVIGDLADTAGHCAPSSCLHWGVRDGETYVTPLRLLQSGPTVLLPGP